MKRFLKRFMLVGIFGCVWATPMHAQRRFTPPAPQGFFTNTIIGQSVVEIQGLRVPVVIRGEAHEHMLILAALWTRLSGTTLRVVSASDHIHTRKSAHYRDAAIDFQGEPRWLNDFAKWMRGWGYRVLWRVPGHWKHVHVETQEKR